MESREVSATTVADAIVRFLRSPRASAGLAADAAEGLEVAAQCLEAAYDLTDREAAGSPPDLWELFRAHAAAPAAAAFVSAAATAFPGSAPPPGATFVAAGTAGPFVVPGFPPGPQPSQPPRRTPVDPETRARADALKNEGNALMKEGKHAEALQKYTDAIALDSTNAIYFCNRAAAHSGTRNNEAAIEDCRRALEINPKYGRAYGRLGLALTNLNRHAEAREAYKIACRLEPDNEAYRNNLAVTEDTLASRGQARGPPGGVGVDIGSLLQNPTLANVATQMLSDPGLQTFMGRLLGNLGGGAAGGAPGPGAGAGAGSGAGAAAGARTGDSTPGDGGDPNAGLNILLQAGQQLAQQMQQANPELVEQLRRQMTQGDREPPNPPGRPQ